MRYREWIRESLRYEEFEKEKERWVDLLNKLITYRDINYGSHPSTGIVYDIRIIKKQISILDSKIKEQKEKLDV